MIIHVLDDDHGISYAAWSVMYDCLVKMGKCQDIIDNVKIVEDRVYLTPLAARGLLNEVNKPE